jgi:hypothetical protein
MTQPPPSPQQITTLACELSTVLTDQQRDYCSASQIKIDYLHDIPTAARLLCRGSYFAEALRLLSLYNLIPQIPDVINTALIEKSDEITKIMADCRLQLAVQVLEIKGLRVKKTKKPLTFFGSDTILVREEYLVNSVRRLIKRVNDVHVEVGRLMEGLATRGLVMEMSERVEVVKNEMMNIVEECKRARGEVWGVINGKREGVPPRGIPPPRDIPPLLSTNYSGSWPPLLQPLPSNLSPFNPSPSNPSPSNPSPFNPFPSPSNPSPFNPSPFNPFPSPSNPSPFNPSPFNPSPSKHNFWYLRMLWQQSSCLIIFGLLSLRDILVADILEDTS